MCAILAPGVAVTLAAMRGNSAITPVHSCLVFGTVCGVQTSGELPPQKNWARFCYPPPQLFRHLEVPESREIHDSQ
jgi:hypothetical protein